MEKVRGTARPRGLLQAPLSFLISTLKVTSGRRQPTFPREENPRERTGASFLRERDTVYAVTRLPVTTWQVLTGGHFA